MGHSDNDFLGMIEAGFASLDGSSITKRQLGSEAASVISLAEFKGTPNVLLAAAIALSKFVIVDRTLASLSASWTKVDQHKPIGVSTKVPAGNIFIMGNKITLKIFKGNTISNGQIDESWTFTSSSLESPHQL